VRVCHKAAADATTVFPEHSPPTVARMQKATGSAPREVDKSAAAR